jgi:PAS domain S-box-containing protein
MSKMPLSDEYRVEGRMASPAKRRNTMIWALEAAGVGEWDADLTTGRVEFSPRANRLFGFSDRCSVTIDELRARYHPEDAQRITEETRVALDDPAVAFLRSVFRILKDDGAVVWVEARGKIFRDRDGKATRTLGVMIDITDQKGVETALEQSWQRFESALMNTSVVLFQQDRELRYIWIHNPRLGYEAQSVIGQTDSELLGEDRAKVLDAIKRRAIETGTAQQEIITVLGPQGTGRYDLHVEPLRDASREIVGVTCAAIEVSGYDHHDGNPPDVLKQTIRDRDHLLDRIGARADKRGRALITTCSVAMQRKLRGFVSLAEADLEILSGLQSSRRFVPARKEFETFAFAGRRRTWLVGNGWVYSYRLLSDGGRQIIGFHVPGDVIGLNSSVRQSSGHSYAAVTDCVICELDQRALNDIRHSETDLADALVWSAARDEAILEQHLISLGRRSAAARVAHLMLELGARLELVGLADEGGYRCPLTQSLIGDALGLTGIHVNRVLRELREADCLTFRNGYVSIDDRERLVGLAEFDPGYLNQGEGGCPPERIAAHSNYNRGADGALPDRRMRGKKK